MSKRNPSSISRQYLVPLSNNPISRSAPQPPPLPSAETKYRGNDAASIHQSNVGLEDIADDSSESGSARSRDTDLDERAFARTPSPIESPSQQVASKQGQGFFGASSAIPKGDRDTDGTQSHLDETQFSVEPSTIGSKSTLPMGTSQITATQSSSTELGGHGESVAAGDSGTSDQEFQEDEGNEDEDSFDNSYDDWSSDGEEDDALGANRSVPFHTVPDEDADTNEAASSNASAYHDRTVSQAKPTEAPSRFGVFPAIDSSSPIPAWSRDGIN